MNIEDARSRALDLAVGSSPGYSPKEIVERAKAFYSYLMDEVEDDDAEEAPSNRKPIRDHHSIPEGET